MSATALGIAGLIASLAGSGTSAGLNIAKARKEEEYQKRVEQSAKKEMDRQEKENRMQALANYIGLGGDEVGLMNRTRPKYSNPKAPYLAGYDIGSGLANLASQYGTQLYNKYGN